MSSGDSFRSTVDASTASSDDASLTFEDSLLEDLDLWVGSVPSENDPSFKSLVQSE
jgi:hypothetical protein